MGLFNDKIRQSFGFPTKKESLDHNIKNYQIMEEQAFAHSMALRNLDISYIQEQIRIFEKIINDNQLFIDAYNTIKEKATDKINEGANPIMLSLKDAKGNTIIHGNYKTLKSYEDTLIKKGIGPQALSLYVFALGKAYETMWKEYARRIIQGEGFLDEGLTGECMDIYIEYNKVLTQINAGFLKDANRTPIKLNSRNIELIIEAYDWAMKLNTILVGCLQMLKNSLEKLNSQQATDEFAKKQIEQVRQMLASTEEYFYAKKSQEFLDTINELKR